jgi:hypothetical protein
LDTDIASFWHEINKTTATQQNKTTMPTTTRQHSPNNNNPRRECTYQGYNIKKKKRKKPQLSCLRRRPFFKVEFACVVGNNQFATFNQRHHLMNANNDDESGNGILNCQMPFHEIKSDKTTSRCNTVHCSTANKNFQAGESIELHPPVHINIYVSHVAAILQVDQQSSPQRVLLSLFLDEKKEINIKLHPPDKRSYVRYPFQRLVWTRYQGWFPTSRVQCEAFVVAPWEVDEAINHAEVCIGMNNA